MGLATLVGVVGIYIIGGFAYQKYQAYKAQVGSVGGAANLLTGLLSSP